VSGAARTVAVSLPRWLAAVALLWIDHLCIAAVRAHPERRRAGLALLWAADFLSPLQAREKSYFLPNFTHHIDFIGGCSRTRTCDPLIKSQLLRTELLLDG
jgi:hypothetical protein